MLPAPSPAQRASLLSGQVSGSRYFFLELARKRGRPWALTLGGREQCNPDYLLDRAGYAYWVFEYVAEGAGEITLNGRRQALGPGSIFAYAPEMRCVMRTDPARPMLKYFFAVTGSGAARRLARAGLVPGRVRTVSAHAEIRSVAEDLIREGQHGGRHTRAICLVLLELLLLKLADAGTGGRVDGALARENFQRCKALLDTHAERYATLEEAAAEAGMDVSSVCRLFRRFQGTSPYQYLLRRKMNLAAGLLVDSGLLVKEAAQRVGFADPFHFARCFKAVHGVPPSAIRGCRT